MHPPVQDCAIAQAADCLAARRDNQATLPLWPREHQPARRKVRRNVRHPLWLHQLLGVVLTNGLAAARPRPPCPGIQLRGFSIAGIRAACRFVATARLTSQGSSVAAAHSCCIAGGPCIDYFIIILRLQRTSMSNVRTADHNGE